METKKCTKCGEIKAFKFFSKSSGYRDGMSSQCIQCKRLITKNWNKNNVNRVLNYEKQRAAKRVKDVSVSHVSAILKIPVSLITKELYELKREHLLNKRALLLLNKTLKELNEK